jgi:glutamate racemase
MGSDVSQYPIGIFDSGVGGLNVAKAIVQCLPNESIYYFGDTAHLPYGDKSVTTIQNYSLVIVDKLLKEKCKIILIACNTASAAAYDVVRNYVGNRAIVIDVIEPLVKLLKKNYTQKTIGLIGTKLTVKSDVYGKKLADNGVKINLQSLATPLLVPIIEEGFGQHKMIDVLLDEYLAAPQLRNIEVLILACTHYPLIKAQIARYYSKLFANKASNSAKNVGRNVEIIDSSTIVAKEVQKVLAENSLLNEVGSNSKHFFVSDFTETFAAQAKMFFGDDIVLKYHP